MQCWPLQQCYKRQLLAGLHVVPTRQVEHCHRGHGLLWVHRRRLLEWRHGLARLHALRRRDVQHGDCQPSVIVHRLRRWYVRHNVQRSIVVHLYRLSCWAVQRRDRPVHVNHLHSLRRRLIH